MHPLSEQFSDTIKSKGGATVDLKTGKAPTSGVMVSKHGTEEIIHGAAEPEDVDSFIEKHKDNLMQPQSHLGGWAEDGKTYLDESLVINNERKARDFGRANAQRAVYNIGADKVRRVRYEPRMSPAGTLFEGFRKSHSTYSRAVSESSRREVEFDLDRAHMAAQSRRQPQEEPSQGEQLKLW